MSPRRHRDSAGASLPNRLLILLTVPLLAVGIATTLQAVAQWRIAQTEARIRGQVESVVAVNMARRGLEAELIPALSARDYELMTITGEHVDSREAAVLQRLIALLPGLRTQADKAFANAITAAPDPSVQAQLRNIHHQLVLATTSPSGQPTYTRWVALEGELDSVANTLLTRLNSSGVPARTSQALNDVATVAPAAQWSSRLVAALISTTMTTLAPEVTASQAEFAKAWGAYQAASARVLEGTSAPMRRAWAAANATAGAKTVDKVLLDGVSQAGPPVRAQLSVLGSLQEIRQAALNAVVDDSLHRAQRVAAEAEHDAQRNVLLIVALDALLIVITLGLALLVRRWLTRSLDRLAAQARQISEGKLPEVEISGPREVRTVARALASAVATLRGIQKQADALADGSIDGAAATSAAPGPLGEFVHASIMRVSDAMRSQELAQQALAHRAAHDPLTDLPNRGYIVDLLNRSLHRAQRNGVMTGLLFIDLDHFKAINDTFGHAAGDFVLQTASKRMAQAVREGDVVARLGGDEFVVLLEDLSSETRFVELGRRLVEALAEPMMFEGRALRIGASIGVAVCRDGAVDGDRLMREADAAVYRAKAGGRNRVEIFDEDLRRELSAHTDMDAALHRALTNDEFLVFYQPVVDISTGAATGMEALIRWDRPGFGMVPPNDFIPVAESSSLINDIGRWVLGEATRQLAEWTERDPTSEHLTIAVNISGRHLVSSELVQDVADALARSGIAPHRLVIELTETMLVDNARCGANMLGLRRLGVQVALDDFGTGYTSIGQLQKLPIDMLKIDRSFVSSTDPSQLELCKLMVSAGRALGLGVIAEGVETEAQADALRHIHVQSCQGFLFARPMPAGDVDTVRLTEPAAGRTHV